MKMELGDNPRKPLLWFDRIVEDLERVGRPLDHRDIDIMIIGSLTSHDDDEVRTLEGSSDWPTRESIKREVINQFDPFERGKSAAGARAVTVVRDSGRNHDFTETCVLCLRVECGGATCRQYRTVKRKKNEGAKYGRGGGGGNSRRDSGGGNGRCNNGRHARRDNGGRSGGRRNHCSNEGRSDTTSNEDDQSAVRSARYSFEGLHTTSYGRIAPRLRRRNLQEITSTEGCSPVSRQTRPSEPNCTPFLE